MTQHLLFYFERNNLPEEQACIAGRFLDLATRVHKAAYDCEEAEAALRKLLEAQDAALRALHCPGRTEGRRG